MKVNKIILFGTLLGLSVTGCKKDLDTDVSSSNVSSKEFSYSTAGAVEMNLTGKEHMADAVFEIYTNDPSQGGKKIGKAKLDDQGNFYGAYVIPHMFKTVHIKSLSLGMPSMDVPVENGRISSLMAHGSASGKSGQTIFPGASSVANAVYSYMGSYNTDGVPNYLTTPDVVTAAFMSDINASLPEFQSVPSNRPHYIATANQSEIMIHDSGDVWITFIHEGAAMRNTLGYFVYNKYNPPQTVNDIDSVHVVFPNASYSGAGGGLATGDKVYLGKFNPGQVIGWVLIQNGYNTTTQAVDFGNTKFYSTPDWNPEPTAALQKHNVLLWDNMRERMVLGFEDVARTQPSCDNDFNDALFYVTATPTSSIYNPGIPRFVNGGVCPDTDGDGVNDCQDDFPNDDDRAFKVYTPYDSGFTSIGFEDLWPAKGDWDFNDLLLDINYMHVTSAENQLVDFEYTSVVRHVGATFQNGFGIEFPLTSSNLSGVTGTDYTSNIITNTAAGVEAGQSNAVVVFFDDAHDQLYDTMVVSASLNSTVSFAQFVVDELNPFCISNATRGREIHLKGKPATDLASASFYGQVDDVTDGSSTWYQTVDGEPWAISVSHEYAPPVESVSIENGYLKWSIWVASGGETYPDWYQNDPGYRNPANLQ